MKASQLILILCSMSLVTLAGCDQSKDKKSGRKVRVSSKMRTQKQWDFRSQNQKTEQTTPAETTSTNNALCDVPAQCHSIRVNVLADGTFDGIGRKDAANAGPILTIEKKDTETPRVKHVVSTIKFSSYKNQAEKLLIVVVASEEKTKSHYEDKLKDLGLKNVTVEYVTSSATKETFDKKKLVDEKTKVLMIAPTSEELTASKSKLGLDTASTLVDTEIATRDLREEALKLIGAVIPVGFRTFDKASSIKEASILVSIDDKRLSKPQDFIIDRRSDTPFLRITLLKRSLLGAKSVLKITYDLK